MSGTPTRRRLLSKSALEEGLLNVGMSALIVASDAGTVVEEAVVETLFRGEEGIASSFAGGCASSESATRGDRAPIP